MTKHPHGNGGNDDGDGARVACDDNGAHSDQYHQQQQQRQQQARNHHERQVYTPAHFTLAKNAELHMDSIRPDAFSPATIRMTDSLERILTDDDDFVEAKQRLRRGREGSLMGQEAGCDDANGRGGTTIEAAGTAASIAARRSPPDDVDDVPVGDRGAFRRIQSTGSDSVDEEMDGVMAFRASSGDRAAGRPDAISHDNDDDDEDDEEELEISQINDNEDVDENDDDDDEAKTDVSIGRPKPLNFDRPSGPQALDGGPSAAVSASGGGAFKLL